MRQNIYQILIFIFSFGIFLIFPPITTQAQQYATTSVMVLMVCGDGFKDVGEVCDAPDFGGARCTDFGFTGGDMACSADCMHLLTTLCSTCPNGIKEGYEQCDGSDYGGNTCATYGYNSGSLSCTTNCNVVLTACSSVGLTDPGPGTTQGGGSAGGGGSLPGFYPGADSAAKETKLVVIGKAYPGSDVNILLDGKVIGVVRADSKADFYFETNTVTPGVVGMGLWAEDSKGLRSALLTLTFRITSNAVTTISGVYLSPSIDVDKPIIGKGEILKIFGTTVPDSQVEVHVNSSNEVIKQASSTVRGDWTMDFDTTPLAADEYHTTKALFQLKATGNIIKSGYSKSVSFYVGKSGTQDTCSGADLNRDKKVNLVDFSILLYYWGTDNLCADLNHNKKVDLIDFSIMLYYWTG